MALHHTNSFPSGHTVTIFGLCTFLALCSSNRFVTVLLLILSVLVLKVLGNEIWGRPLLILGVTLVLAGIQFLTFGIIAELIMRVYYESQHKKTYHIREVFQKKEHAEEMFV